MSPKLTADQALAKFKEVDRLFNPPSAMTSYLGYYTAPIGNGDYRFEHRLAWGYRWGPAGCPSVGNPNAPPSPAGQCYQWVFLDANTGEMLEGVSERV